MIDIRGLYKRYHQHSAADWVLKDINLTLPAGVSVGLLGRNGAGKSTLLRLIAGMDTPERGDIQRRARVSWPMGLAGGFQGSMTGRQNVKFVARVHGGRRNVQSVIDSVEAFAELGSAFDEPIRTYSSGMRARLNFGLSLAFDFDVYLSDEATSVGDRAFKAKASKAFKERVNRASLIMVSHSEGILLDLCQAGVYLKDGGALWFDDIREAIAAYHADSDAVLSGQGISSATSSAATRARRAPPERAIAVAHPPVSTSMARASNPSPTSIAVDGDDRPGAQRSSAEGTTDDALEAMDMAELRHELRLRKAAFDGAKATAKRASSGDAQDSTDRQQAAAITIARDRLHTARRLLQARKRQAPPSD
ncbi:ABC transporter ATP-binding protein [Halomonas sp. V046]|uniref:ABC transporter ATP-binding protein n=1 Tax=Halomonas sp. V046 TaxID=3459611 RepID=UPI0040440B9F